MRLTAKALYEVRSLELGLGAEDVVDLLVALRQGDSAGRVRSASSSEWLFVFKPNVADRTVYIKLVLRGDCVVVSFHEDALDDENF